MRARPRLALTLLVSLGLPTFAGAQSELVNPDDVTYDPRTGRYYDASAVESAEREVPRPNGTVMDPSQLFDAPMLDLPSPPPKPTPGAGNPMSFNDTGPGSLWGAPVSTGTGNLVDIGGTSYPSDGSLAMTPVGGSAFTNAPVSEVSGFVNLGPGSLNVPSATSASREASVQVMIVMFLEGTVPGSRQARREGRLASLVPALLPQAGSGPPLKAWIRARAVSSGEAFEVEAVNQEGYPIELAAAGVVVEPLRARDGKDVQDALERSSEPRLHLTADGYCLEYERQPPPEGMAYRVAGPQLQKRYPPMRSVLRAARKLLDEGGLTPDSDPEPYFHSIVQWALWSKEQGFDAESFAEAFLERTRKNFEAARQPFTREIETTVRALAPNQWKDVAGVLNGAAALDR